MLRNTIHSFANSHNLVSRTSLPTRQPCAVISFKCIHLKVSDFFVHKWTCINNEINVITRFLESSESRSWTHSDLLHNNLRYFLPFPRAFRLNELQTFSFTVISGVFVTRYCWCRLLVCRIWVRGGYFYKKNVPKFVYNKTYRPIWIKTTRQFVNIIELNFTISKEIIKQIWRF